MPIRLGPQAGNHAPKPKPLLPTLDDITCSADSRFFLISDYSNALSDFNFEAGEPLPPRSALVMKLQGNRTFVIVAVSDGYYPTTVGQKCMGWLSKYAREVPSNYPVAFDTP